MGYGEGPVTLSVSNVDDVFMHLSLRGVREVLVTREQQFIVARFYATYKHTSTQLGWKTIGVLRAGKVDTLFTFFRT